MRTIVADFLLSLHARPTAQGDGLPESLGTDPQCQTTVAPWCYGYHTRGFEFNAKQRRNFKAYNSISGALGPHNFDQ